MRMMPVWFRLSRASLLTMENLNGPLPVTDMLGDLQSGGDARSIQVVEGGFGRRHYVVDHCFMFEGGSVCSRSATANRGQIFEGLRCVHNCEPHLDFGRFMYEKGLQRLPNCIKMVNLFRHSGTMMLG